MFSIRERVLECDGMVSVLWLPSNRMILGKSFKFSESEFPLLRSEDNNNAYLTLSL